MAKGHRHADGQGVGRHAPLDSAEGGHQAAARDVDQVDRHLTRFGGHLGPVADPAQVSGAAQCNDRDAGPLGLVHAEPDGLRPDRLAEAEMAVGDGHDLVLGDDGQALAGPQSALFHPLQIARYADHAVAVVAGQVGSHEIVADAGCFRACATGGREGLLDQGSQGLGMNDHSRLLAVAEGRHRLRCPGSSDIIASRPPC
jgi:hypothetical protein